MAARSVRRCLAHEAETVQMRRTNGQKTQMINTIVGCPATLRFGVVQDRLRYLSEKDALRRKRSLAGADHTLLQVSPVGTPAVIPARTNSATPANRTWAYEDSPFGQNADAEYCQGIAKIDPYWVSDCS